MPPSCILVVDDDSDIREAVAEALAQEGHAVETAANGREAMDLLSAVAAREQLPDLILLDLRMPVLDGAGFMQELHERERLAAIPVFVLSAEDDVREVAGALCAAGYVRKPMRMKDVLGVVQASLGGD